MGTGCDMYFEKSVTFVHVHQERAHTFSSPPDFSSKILRKLKEFSEAVEEVSGWRCEVHTCTTCTFTRVYVHLCAGETNTAEKDWKRKERKL